MAMGIIFCGSKRNPMMNYVYITSVSKYSEFTYPSEFTEFTYPPSFKDTSYQVKNATINVDRNDYDKPKKVN